jgi:arylsulfatase A-like enzyme
MGPGVPAGSSDEAVRTVDMAPTLAELAGIPYPDGLDGRPLIRAAR